MPRPRDDDDGEDAPPIPAKVWSRRGDGETMPKETIKHRLPPRDGPAPTVGSRQNFESRGALGASCGLRCADAAPLSDGAARRSAGLVAAIVVVVVGVMV